MEKCCFRVLGGAGVVFKKKTPKTRKEERTGAESRAEEKYFDAK